VVNAVRGALTATCVAILASCGGGSGFGSSAANDAVGSGASVPGTAVPPQGGSAPAGLTTLPPTDANGPTIVSRPAAQTASVGQRAFSA
jgi:hypothetical protein